MPKKVDWSNESPKIKEVELSYGAIAAQIKFIQGKVLTVVDASYGDAVQRKAIKDIINSYFRDSLDWIYDLTHKGVQTLGETQMVQVNTEETSKDVK